MEVLRGQWDMALFGRNMGERTRMAYWVDRERYPTPEPGTRKDRPGPDHQPGRTARDQRAGRVRAAQGIAQTGAGERPNAARERLLQDILEEMGVDKPAAGGTRKQGPAG